MVSMAISIINLNYILIDQFETGNLNAFIWHDDEKQEVDLCFKSLLSKGRYFQVDRYFRDLLTSTRFYHYFRGFVTLGTLRYAHFVS